MESTDYVDLEKPGAYSSASGYARVKNISRSQAHDLIKNIKSYQLHARSFKKFRRRRCIFRRVDEIWGMDLKSIVSQSKSNYNKKWLLCCVDGLSKFGMVEAIPNKEAETVIAAFKRILKRTGRSPQKLALDKAAEFWSRKTRDFCKAQGIEMYYVNSPLKISFVERFIQSLFKIIARYQTQKGTKRFVTKLHHFENLYNNSYNRSINRKPVDVSKRNEMEVFDTIYGKDTIVKTRRPLSLKTRVLRKIEKSHFAKGYTQSFDPKVYTIHVVKRTNPETYVLKDPDGVILERSYYREELFEL